MNLREKALIFLATGFGIGYIPVIPGTFGTLPGLALCYLLTRVPAAAALLGIVSLVLLAMWIAGKAERSLGQKDPRTIVIDEIAGMTVALAGLPFEAYTVLAGFAAFRVFDALKPFPLRNFEKRFSGGIGVVMDDVGAGVYANILIRLSIWLIEMTR